MPFVQHIYGTLFYILLVMLYSLVLLQKFYPTPEPQEFAVYAVQGLHLGMSVFTVVRDWRRAHEFIWHRRQCSRSLKVPKRSFFERGREPTKQISHKPVDRLILDLAHLCDHNAQLVHQR